MFSAGRATGLSCLGQREQNVVTGRKMRVDTTVVETNIHYPTDSTLLGDGVRVLTRLMKKVDGGGWRAGHRSAGPHAERETRVLEIAISQPSKGARRATSS